MIVQIRPHRFVQRSLVTPSFLVGSEEEEGEVEEEEEEEEVEVEVEEG